ncbi:MAG TPA: MarR family transcriptional regulator [Burkholderiaceae bacterium]|nr:MarR family transcriptional regulator [Burkholderiaceae bacterium]
MSHCLDQSDLLRLLGYNIAQAAIPAYKLFDSLIGLPLGLRQVEFSILSLVQGNDKVTHKRLSTALGVAAPNLTIVLDRLEQRQLVKRTRSPHDARMQYIRLTPKGRALHAKAKQIADTMENELLSHFSAGERTMLFELLQKVAAQRRP